jgi:hypothetical protein
MKRMAPVGMTVLVLAASGCLRANAETPEREAYAFVREAAGGCASSRVIREQREDGGERLRAQTSLTRSGDDVIWITEEASIDAAGRLERASVTTTRSASSARSRVTIDARTGAVERLDEAGVERWTESATEAWSYELPAVDGLALATPVAA